MKKKRNNCRLSYYNTIKVNTIRPMDYIKWNWQRKTQYDTILSTSVIRSYYLTSKRGSMFIRWLKTLEIVIICFKNSVRAKSNRKKVSLLNVFFLFDEHPTNMHVVLCRSIPQNSNLESATKVVSSNSSVIVITRLIEGNKIK